MNVKDKIMRRNAYDPTPAQKKLAHRRQLGVYTEKKAGDLIIDLYGRCFVKTKNGQVPRESVG